MEQQQISGNEPLCDVFATQGILVILTALGVIALHIFAPEYCNALLREWHRLSAESPDLAGLISQAAEWFASICSG